MTRMWLKLSYNFCKKLLMVFLIHKVESLSATPSKAKKDDKKTPQSTHDMQVEDILPSPSISPSGVHAESVPRNKRYSPIIGLPTPLTQVSPETHRVVLKPTKHQEVRLCTI